MKKLMIAACAVALAAVAQAGTVSWTVTNVMDSTGAAANDNAGYLFSYLTSQAGTVEYKQSNICTYIQALYAGAEVAEKGSGYTAVANFLSDNAYAFTPATAGTYTLALADKKEATEIGAAVGANNFYWVFIDKDVDGNITKIATSQELTNKSISSAAANTPLVFASQATNTGADKWTAVPEPTSGLLMLLGMGALALRRRRA